MLPLNVFVFVYYLVITDMFMFLTVKVVFKYGRRQAICVCLEYYAPKYLHGISERLQEFTLAEQENKKINLVPPYWIFSIGRQPK